MPDSTSIPTYVQSSTWRDTQGRDGVYRIGYAADGHVCEIIHAPTHSGFVRMSDGDWWGLLYSPGSAIPRTTPRSAAYAQTFLRELNVAAVLDPTKPATTIPDPPAQKQQASWWDDVPDMPVGDFGVIPRPTFDFVLPGVLKGTVSMMVAPGATGKSLTMLGLSHQLATAEECGFPSLLDPNGLVSAGKKVKPRKVLILNAEDLPQVVHARCHDIVQYKRFAHLRSKQGNDLIRQNFRIKDLYGKQCSIMNEDGVEGAAWDEGLFELCEWSDIVWVDTLTRVHQADENKNGLMAKLVGMFERLARECNTAVVLSHHINKNAAANDPSSQDAARGASSLTNNCRHQTNLWRMPPNEAEDRGIDELERRDWVAWDTPKVNYAPQSSGVMWLRNNKGVLMEEKPRDKMPKSAKGKGGGKQASAQAGGYPSV